MTPVANFATSFASVVDTGGKFSAGVNDTGGIIATGINETGGKFRNGRNGILRCLGETDS